jgi:septal ring factor EnvC (AmiA/AmiB activator)
MGICLREIAFVAVIIVIGLKAFTQSRQELETQKEKAIKEVNFTNSLLENTRISRKASLNKLILLKNKVYQRNSIINNINAEIKLIDENIGEKENIIRSLEEDLRKVKIQYERLIYYAYRNKKFGNKITYVFASNSFNKAFKRIKYIQQVAEYRRKEARLIVRLQEIIEKNIEELEEDKRDKKSLIADKEKEREKLKSERNEQNDLIVKLQRREKELRKMLNEKRSIASRLEKEINDLIAEEARKARSLERLTPEQKIIADNFRSNKGRLPWPTEKGIITEKFGLNNHEVLKGVKVKNNGVDIATIQGAIVRAVFEGEVRKIIAIPGANQAVIIRHGNYLSVYQNLINVGVKNGDLVKVKDMIGKVYTDSNNDNKTILHFEIWEENRKLDPSIWLSGYQ